MESSTEKSGRSIVGAGVGQFPGAPEIAKWEVPTIHEIVVGGTPVGPAGRFTVGGDLGRTGGPPDGRADGWPPPPAGSRVAPGAAWALLRLAGLERGPLVQAVAFTPYVAGGKRWPRWCWRSPCGAAGPRRSRP